MFPKNDRLIFWRKITSGVAIILFSRGSVSVLRCNLRANIEFCQIFAISLRPTFPRCQTLYFSTAFEGDHILPPNFWLYKLWTTFVYFPLLKVFISHKIHKQARKSSQDLYRFRTDFLFFQYWRELHCNNWTAQKEHLNIITILYIDSHTALATVSYK